MKGHQGSASRVVGSGGLTNRQYRNVPMSARRQPPRARCAENGSIFICFSILNIFDPAPLESLLLSKSHFRKIVRTHTLYYHHLEDSPKTGLTQPPVSTWLCPMPALDFSKCLASHIPNYLVEIF